MDLQEFVRKIKLMRSQPLTIMQHDVLVNYCNSYVASCDDFDMTDDDKNLMQSALMQAAQWARQHDPEAICIYESNRRRQERQQAIDDLQADIADLDFQINNEHLLHLKKSEVILLKEERQQKKNKLEELMDEKL